MKPSNSAKKTQTLLFPFDLLSVSSSIFLFLNKTLSNHFSISKSGKTRQVSSLDQFCNLSYILPTISTYLAYKLEGLAYG